MKLLIINFLFLVQGFSATELRYQAKLLSYNNKTFTVQVYESGKKTSEKLKFPLKHLSEKQFRNRHKLVGKVIKFSVISPR